MKRVGEGLGTAAIKKYKLKGILIALVTLALVIIFFYKEQFLRLNAHDQLEFNMYLKF